MKTIEGSKRRFSEEEFNLFTEETAHFFAFGKPEDLFKEYDRVSAIANEITQKRYKTGIGCYNPEALLSNAIYSFLVRNLKSQWIKYSKVG